MRMFVLNCASQITKKFSWRSQAEYDGFNKFVSCFLMVKKGQETFCPATYRPRTYIVPGQYVAFEVCFEGGRGCS